MAWHLAQSGRRTAVVERRWIGGSCPNIACLPSKNEIWSARVAHLARHAAQFGTVITGPVTTDMAKVRQRKRDMVDHEIELHLHNYKTTGAELIMGSGRFVAPKTLEVQLNDGGTRVLAGDQVFLNLGTHAAIPPVPGLEGRPAADPYRGARTRLRAVASGRARRRLCRSRTGPGLSPLRQPCDVIETGPQLMAREDPDVADEMQRILRDEGIQFSGRRKPSMCSGRSGDSVSLTVRTPSGEQKIEGSDILVAAGRVPNTAGIGLEEAGVELDARGYIRVNERLETTAPDVWAIGECAGSPQFTHVSDRRLSDHPGQSRRRNRSTRDRLVPYCMFTDPPLAHVGLSEREAQQPRHRRARRAAADERRAPDGRRPTKHTAS